MARPKRRFLPLLFIVLTIGTSLFTRIRLGFPQGLSEARIDVYFFYADDCQPCGPILKDYLPTLKTMFPALQIKTFDLKNPGSYEALTKLEERFGRRDNPLPVVFIGDQVLAGEMEVMERLNPLLLEYQAKGGASLPAIEEIAETTSSGKEISVELAYFYQKGCPKCERANYLLRYLVKKYPRLVVREIDINTPDGKRLNETLANRLSLPPEKRLVAPSIFIGSDYVAPEGMTESTIEGLIRKYKKVETQSALKVEKEEVKRAEQSIVTRFKSLGVLTVVSAGVLDGINPCAFATLIFFISYLTMVGRKRSEIFWIGLGFSAAVFATYLLIGLGILRFIQHFSFLPLFSRIVYVLTFAFALGLGIFSLYDYVQLRRGKPSEMKLQLPDFLKKRIHKTIRQESRSGRYFLAAITAGFIISLLEFTCTGQVYLPTILFVTHVPSMKASALSYLILYNVMFIVPLLTIFGVVYWGITSEQLAFFLQKKTTTIKLYTALLFFFLAALLIVNFVF